MREQLSRFLKDMDWSLPSGLAAKLIGITLVLSGRS